MRATLLVPGIGDFIAFQRNKRRVVADAAIAASVDTRRVDGNGFYGPAVVMMADGMRRVGSSNAAMMSSIGPIATIFMGYQFLDEPITAIQLIERVW